MSFRRSAGVAVLLGVALSATLTWTVHAQSAPTAEPPLTVPTIAPTSTTTSTVPGSTSTSPPPGAPGSPGSGPAAAPPPGSADPSQDVDGGGGCAPICPDRPIPADAQAVLSALVRSAPNDNRALVAGEQALLAAGYDADQAARLAYGRFPVAGPATWADDWLNPRWTGDTFRFHLGLDLVAPYGTPLRSPDDGVIRIDSNPLSGLAVSVYIPDGSFYYLAHLSSVAEGLHDGQAVHTGDLLGYVGQSGDATGPHCHFGIYAAGTTPIPPKPLVDTWVMESVARVAQLLQPAADPAARPLLGTGLVRDLTAADRNAASAPTGPTRGDLLYATSASPSGGALQVAQAAAREVAVGVDWAARAREQEAFAKAWAQSSEQAWAILGPLTPAALRPAARSAQAHS
jgi:hypothetical protein